MVGPIIPIVIAGASLLLSGCGKNKNNATAPIENTPTTIPTTSSLIVNTATPIPPINTPTPIPTSTPIPTNTPSDANKALIQVTPQVYNPMDSHNFLDWQKSNYVGAGGMNCVMDPLNISFDSGYMKMNLAGSYPNKSSEYKSYGQYSFGQYEIRMKTANSAGIVGGAFGVKSGTYGNSDYNEITMQVLGSDPTKILLNHIYGSSTLNENRVEVALGFDATLDQHNYGFSWGSGSVEFFVDGVSIRSVISNIPQNPSYIFTNLYPGANNAEMNTLLGGIYNGEAVQLKVDWIKQTP